MKGNSGTRAGRYRRSLKERRGVRRSSTTGKTKEELLDLKEGLRDLEEFIDTEASRSTSEVEGQTLVKFKHRVKQHLHTLQKQIDDKVAEESSSGVTEKTEHGEARYRGNSAVESLHGNIVTTEVVHSEVIPKERTRSAVMETEPRGGLHSLSTIWKHVFKNK
jgi:hypothetical protein